MTETGDALAPGRRVFMRPAAHRGGRSYHPGRVGTLIRRNLTDPSLWYVDLDATARAKQRQICCFEKDLALMLPEQGKPDGAQP
jgi:hypothetical protein